MTSFKTWLDANPGLGAKLTQIFGVNATFVSNVKHRRRAMPVSWMRFLVRFSKQQLTLDSLIQEHDEYKQRIR